MRSRSRCRTLTPGCGSTAIPARPAGRAGRHPAKLPASDRARRGRRRCGRPRRRDGGRRHGRPRRRPPGRCAAGLTGTIADLKHVVILMQENRSFDHYFGTLLRRSRIRRQAGPHLAERAQRCSSSPTPPAPTSATCYPYNLTDQTDGDLDHSWARRPRGVEQRPVEPVGRGQGRRDDGLLHPVRDPVPVRAGGRVHHLRRLPPGDHGPDQPQPDVLLDRHLVRLDLATRATTRSTSAPTPRRPRSPRTRSCSRRPG